ncbi:LPS translocon maturation chaperone LptM [Thaumasiovibrio sp. DFM-14]
MQRRFLALFLLVTLVMAGCGQSGPLYMPKEDAPKEQQ